MNEPFSRPNHVKVDDDIPDNCLFGTFERANNLGTTNRTETMDKARWIQDPLSRCILPAHDDKYAGLVISVIAHDNHIQNIRTGIKWSMWAF